ncbi:hypothetical protein KSP40_PGU009023 [Platanthera guangdongensis]|uniref:Uncharacterized protein n=1 Tax=Platanthera guangdongensis TaxID=2320717 RepID=A0ABR2M889_9ASPA
MEAIGGMRVALGTVVILNYCLKGLFHPARKVFEVQSGHRLYKPNVSKSNGEQQNNLHADLQPWKRDFDFSKSGQCRGRSDL